MKNLHNFAPLVNTIGKGTNIVSLVIIATFLCGCNSKKTELMWNKNIYNIGSQSSPRVTDINQDGVLDIVMGAARGENQTTDLGVIAIDGNNGDLLWHQEAKDQVFGSATFYDITEDGISDVFISGRSQTLKALDGKNGSLLWEYSYQFEEDSILRYARFNFYNIVLIPDQNQDGFPELLTVNGGNVKAQPNSEEDRYPGVLMIFDSKNGNIIAADTMPDSKESYMTPIYYEQPESSEGNIVFGTGGETISGNLYVAKLTDLMNGTLSNAQMIASENGHGFIAPPVIADINKDGNRDIVAISHGSSIFAIDGLNFKSLWQQNIPNTESSNSFAVGYFTDDKIPDFYTFLSKGVWPNSTTGIQIMINGATGTIDHMDSLGCVGFSSAVVYDVNKDGYDEAIISFNEFDCAGRLTGDVPLRVENKVLAVDFKNQNTIPIDQTKGFKNMFSTPWVGDLDEDGYLDIVYCQYYSPNAHLLTFLGMNVKRVSTHIRAKKQPLWGGYLGSNGDGLFRNQ